MHAVAKGIVAHSNPSQLQEQGGHLQIGVKWAESFLSRRGYVKRKATKAARKLPPNFEDLKAAFLQRICSEVEQHAIPPKLVINWDQTGSKSVPVSQWTLAEQGITQVPAVGKDDKREITVVLAESAATTRANLSWENTWMSRQDHFSTGMAHIVIITGVQSSNI